MTTAPLRGLRLPSLQPKQASNWELGPPQPAARAPSERSACCTPWLPAPIQSFPKVVNGTVGFGNDALPVKAFNTALAKTTRLASAMALKPMTARIGLTLVIEIEAETDFEKVPLSIFPAPKSFLV